MDDDLDAWLFGNPQSLLPTFNPYADILSQFPKETNLSDYFVTDKGLLQNTAGDTGTFKQGTWIPYTGGDINEFLKGSSASKFVDFAKKAKDALSSPQGIAGLAGMAAGYLDRPKPSGGGTTMAYPGAAKLERKMVQGPYGPLAEYTGVGGGAPDYTPFTAPTFGAPDVGGRAPTTPAPSPGAGMSVQSKVDLYKQLAGYGLGADRIRRIAETFYGPQTDSDWAELTRLAGVGAGGIAAPAPKPGGAPAPVGAPAPAPAPVGAPAPAPAPAADARKYSGMADWLQTNLNPLERAAAYNAYVGSGLTDREVRLMAEKNFGKQTDADWEELKRLAETLPKNLLPTDANKSFYEHDVKAAVLKTTLPADWDSYSPKQKSDWFNANNATPAMLKSQGVTDAQLKALRENGYKFAHGGTVQMEDGGFVLTKRAVDGAGGPRGIAQLVPGARPIRGPGTGTSDSIPATIQGRHGQTPAKVSNGEAYVPKRFVQAQGGPQRMYALMNQLQRKA